MVNTGVPIYGQGKYVNIHSAGLVTNSKQEKVRFGLEFMEGLSHYKGLSHNTKNAFSVDGKLTKMGTMHMEGFDEHADHLKEIKVKGDHCEFTYKMNWKMGPDADVKIVKVIEKYQQGFISGWCKNQDDTYSFEKLDALLIWD